MIIFDMGSNPLRDLHYFITYEREGFLDALEEMYGYELATDMADGIREVVSALALGRDEDDTLGRLGRRALGVDAVIGALRDELDAWVRAHGYAWLELHSTTEGMLDALDRAM